MLVTLPHMSIRARIVIAVALHQIDYAPDTKEPHPPTTEYRRAAELTQRGDSRLYQRAVFLCGGIR